MYNFYITNNQTINLFNEIESLTKKLNRMIVAIDGRCGSGKTTLGKYIASEYNGQVIHMDDYFVPPYLRDDNHKDIGVHYERFTKEVISHLHDDIIQIGIYNCTIGQITDYKSIKNSGVIVVEGSFSLAPVFKKYYDIGVFVTTNKENQLKRIKLRTNDTHKYQAFIDKWIPREERYFEKYQIKEKAQYIVTT